MTSGPKAITIASAWNKVIFVFLSKRVEMAATYYELLDIMIGKEIVIKIMKIDGINWLPIPLQKS